jgi:hypothetical protein
MSKPYTGFTRIGRRIIMCMRAAREAARGITRAAARTGAPLSKLGRCPNSTLRRIGDPSLFPTIASKYADGSPFNGVEHSADKTGRGVAVRASTPLSDFLHDGVLRIDELHTPALEPTLRDSWLRSPTCRNPAAIRCLPGVVIRSLSERSTMYPSPTSRALCWAGIIAGGSSIEHLPTVSREANSSRVSTLRTEAIDSSMARFPNYTCSILLKSAQKSRARRLSSLRRMRPRDLSPMLRIAVGGTGQRANQTPLTEPR